MHLLDEARLTAYLRDDAITRLLDAAQRPGDEALTCQRWLRGSAPKRLGMHSLYADLLAPDAPPRRVVDVGGGLTALTRLLAARHDYRLLDLLAHDDAAAARALEADVGRPFWTGGDWYAAPVEPADVVVASDLFPNVDQRLELFLGRWLPAAREVRLGLTFYAQPRFYMVKRVDADEVMCLLAWDGRATEAALRPFEARIVGAEWSRLRAPSPSIFPNGRSVCIVTLRGERA